MTALADCIPYPAFDRPHLWMALLPLCCARRTKAGCWPLEQPNCQTNSLSTFGGPPAKPASAASKCPQSRLAFNSAGTTLFSAQSEDLQAWEIPSGKQRFSLTASGDIDLIVSDPSSAPFATVTHGRLTVWDATTGARLAQLPDVGYLHPAAFSPDSRYLLTGYDERAGARSGVRAICETRPVLGSLATCLTMNGSVGFPNNPIAKFVPTCLSTESFARYAG